jgi:ribose/xylose/arabinose/galactoside ABC-type transport system permease subunit
VSATTQSAPGRATFGREVRAFFGRRDIQLVPIMIAIAIVATIANPQFMTSRVISNIFIAAMVTTFVALGQVLVMLTKGIDLSVAPILGLSAVIVGFQAQNSGLPLPLGLLLGAAVGAVLGVGNAVLISILGLPPIIATLGTFSIYGGLQFVVTGGSQVNQVPATYTSFGIATNTILPGIPMILAVGIFATLCVGTVLRHSTFGRNIYATGDDYEAAFRAGIPTRRVTFLAYVICGLFAGIAGVVYLTRTGSADALTGTQTNENLNAIAAALIGGAALTGGRGTATGALFGSIFLSLTLSAMGIAAHIPDEWQPAGIGVLILLAVVADTRARRGGTLQALFANLRRRNRA